MTFQQRATTIERGYADDISQGEGSLTTTSPQSFIFVTRQLVAKCGPALPIQVSAASSHRAYHLVSALALFRGGADSGTITGESLLNLEPRTGGSQQRGGPLSRRERHAAVIALLDEWLADESGYDEKAWPNLKTKIEESRTSTRRRFGD